MSSAIRPTDDQALKLLADFVEQECGIYLDESKNYLLISRLAGMIGETVDGSIYALYQKLTQQPGMALTERLINAITTNETTWFREQTPWLILGEIVLPTMITELRSGTKLKIRIWSAAASTGQEIYSTVMYIDNYLRLNKIVDITLNNFEFYATDINSAVLQVATAGRYDAIAMQRGFSGEFADYRDRYFSNSGRYWELAANIRGRVTFSKRNLLEKHAGNLFYDILFLRYVLIYFSETNKKIALANLYEQANKNAVLFCGNSEIVDNQINPFTRIADSLRAYYRKTDKACWQV
ncbi:MAG: protein-glutamate O-methyltransferase CheR [Bacillota bacterium]